MLPARKALMAGTQYQRRRRSSIATLATTQESRSRSQSAATASRNALEGVGFGSARRSRTAKGAPRPPRRWKRATASLMILLWSRITAEKPDEESQQHLEHVVRGAPEGDRGLAGSPEPHVNWNLDQLQ